MVYKKKEKRNHSYCKRQATSFQDREVTLQSTNKTKQFICIVRKTFEWNGLISLPI